VLSFDPADTGRRHGGGRVPLEVVSTSLRSPRTLHAVMRRSDLLISGGGSFLHEADFALHGRSFLFRAGKLRPIPYFLSVILMARSVGLPVMWYAQGNGPASYPGGAQGRSCGGESYPVRTLARPGFRPPGLRGGHAGACPVRRPRSCICAGAGPARGCPATASSGRAPAGESFRGRLPSRLAGAHGIPGKPRDGAGKSGGTL
jgi:hypothetical protein